MQQFWATFFHELWRTLHQRPQADNETTWWTIQKNNLHPLMFFSTLTLKKSDCVVETTANIHLSKLQYFTFNKPMFFVPATWSRIKKNLIIIKPFKNSFETKSEIINVFHTMMSEYIKTRSVFVKCQVSFLGLWSM